MARAAKRASKSRTTRRTRSRRSARANGNGNGHAVEATGETGPVKHCDTCTCLRRSKKNLADLAPDDVLTTNEIAALIKMNPSSVSTWIDDGKLESFRTPGGHRRVYAQSLRMFLEKYGMPLATGLKGWTVEELDESATSGAHA